MSTARFDQAFAPFARRAEERVTPKTFLAVLEELERERAERTINLQARVVGGQLRFEPSDELTVQGNAILVAGQRMVVDVRP